MLEGRVGLTSREAKVVIWLWLVFDLRFAMMRCFMWRLGCKISYDASLDFWKWGHTSLDITLCFGCE